MLIGRVIAAGRLISVRAMDADGSELMEIEDPFAAFAAGRAPADIGPVEVGDVVLAPPVDPPVVVGLAQNGPAHASPVQAWLKSPRSVVASGVAVALRTDAGVPVAEGEIAVVLGRDTEGLTAENAHEYVLGVTAVNDLSSPDRLAWDPRNFESKAGAGYTPLGPWIDTAAEIDTVSMTMSIDDEVTAETDAGALPVSIRASLAYLATWGPFGAGDVVMTGAPFSNFPIARGAVVTVRVGTVTLVTPTL